MVRIRRACSCCSISENSEENNILTDPYKMNVIDCPVCNCDKSRISGDRCPQCDADLGALSRSQQFLVEVKQQMKKLERDLKLRDVRFKRRLILFTSIFFLAGLIVFPIINVLRVEEQKPIEWYYEYIGENIQKNSGFDNLEVELRDQKIYISGDVPSPLHKSYVTLLGEEVPTHSFIDNSSIIPVLVIESDSVPQNYIFSYKVKDGESLSSIAEIFYDDWRKWEDIAEINGIGSPNTIHKGQILKIQLSINESEE